MSSNYPINLPRSHKAQFPQVCVVCYRRNPDSRVHFLTGTLGWWSWLFALWDRPLVAVAPACKSCGWKLYAKRFVSLAVTSIIVVLVLHYVWPELKDHVPRWLHKPAYLCVTLVALAPQILYEVFWAPSNFDITAYSHSVDYEFASLHYASEFVALNNNAAWVKIGDEDISE